MRRLFSILAMGGLLVSCAASTEARFAQDEHDQFFRRLSSLCGQAFAGKMVTDHPTDADLKGKPMIMHVRNCTSDTIKIPLHVENDRSRTWVITRQVSPSARSLILKHDHRHQDGSEDDMTQYGGETLAKGSPTRQEFPADRYSKELFEKAGRPNSSLNIWAMEFLTGNRFIYEVTRPNRHVRFEFDLAQPASIPPPPWGSLDKN